MNAVFRASRDNNIRFLWVDDIIAPAAPVQQRPASMITTAFVSENDGQSFIQYRVGLSFTADAVTAYRNGAWDQLLPEPDDTDWVRIRISRAEKEINVVL
jgi:hypothetical protein